MNGWLTCDWLVCEPSARSNTNVQRSRMTMNIYLKIVKPPLLLLFKFHGANCKIFIANLCLNFCAFFILFFRSLLVFFNPWMGYIEGYINIFFLLDFIFFIYLFADVIFSSPIGATTNDETMSAEIFFLNFKSCSAPRFKERLGLTLRTLFLWLRLVRLLNI